MKSIQEWQAEVHELARAKGWWPELDGDARVSPMVIGDKIALVHSEISEAYEEYQEPGEFSEGAEAHNIDIRAGSDGKPEGFTVELTDAVIRMLDLCAAMGIQISDGKRWKSDSLTAVSEGLLDAHFQASCALEMVRNGVCNDLFAQNAKLLIRTCDGMCANAGRDLYDVIAIKHEYNKTRPIRHGGKLL